MPSHFLLPTALYLLVNTATAQAFQLRGLQDSNDNNLADDLFEISDDYRDGEELKEDSEDALQTLGLVLIIAAAVGVCLAMGLCFFCGSMCGCCAGCGCRGSSEEPSDAFPDEHDTKNADTEVGENNNSSNESSSDDAEKNRG